MPKYDIHVELINNDGNSLAISAEEIAKYREEATAGDYDNLLKVTTEWVEVY